MTGTLLLGRRADGRPIHTWFGAADDDTPEDTPTPDESAALRAELEQLRAQAAASQAEAQQNAERLRELLAGQSAPQADTEDDEDDDDTDSKPDGKPVDPEIMKLRRAVRGANREAKLRREREEKLRADWEAQDKARQEQLVEAQKLSEAAEKARLEAEARYKPATIRAAAVPALLAAGAKAERADRLVRLLDMAALDVDADGEVTGLAEQIVAVKAEWPELFTPAEQAAPKPPRVTGADRPPAEQGPQRSADRIAAQILGGAA